MISLKIKNYDREQMEILLDTLDQCIDCFKMSYCHLNCKSCNAKKVCHDLNNAKQFLSEAINSVYT